MVLSSSWLVTFRPGSAIRRSPVATPSIFHLFAILYLLGTDGRSIRSLLGLPQIWLYGLDDRAAVPAGASIALIYSSLGGDAMTRQRRHDDAALQAYGANMSHAVIRRPRGAWDFRGRSGRRSLEWHRFVITADGYASVEPPRRPHGARRCSLAHNAAVDRVHALDMPGKRSKAWLYLRRYGGSCAMPMREALPGARRTIISRSADDLGYFGRSAWLQDLAVAAARGWQLPEAYIDRPGRAPIYRPFPLRPRRAQDRRIPVYRDACRCIDGAPRISPAVNQGVGRARSRRGRARCSLLTVEGIGCATAATAARSKPLLLSRTDAMHRRERGGKYRGVRQKVSHAHALVYDSG